MAIYSYCNLICFLVELGTLALLSYNGFFNSDLSIFYFGKGGLSAQPFIPMQASKHMETFVWACFMILQFAFVLRGLPCMKPGPHYVNTQLLKI